METPKTVSELMKNATKQVDKESTNGRKEKSALEPFMKQKKPVVLEFLNPEPPMDGPEDEQDEEDKESEEPTPKKHKNGAKVYAARDTAVTKFTNLAVGTIYKCVSIGEGRKRTAIALVPLSAREIDVVTHD